MRKKINKSTLIAFCQLMFLANFGFAQSNTLSSEKSSSYPYRFPEARIDSLIGGRNMLQPLSSNLNPDRVLSGINLSVRYRQFDDYNRTMVSGQGDNASKRINVRPEEIVIGVSLGTQGVAGYKIEYGANFSHFNDREKNELGLAVDQFHRTLKAYGYIPHGRPVGAPFGNGGVDLRNGVRDRLDLYTKTQLSEEKDGSFLPNTAVIISVSVPLTDKDYDNLGAGVALALSKKIVEWATFQAAASFACQNSKPSDYGSTDIFVRKCTYNTYAGLVIDPGEKGGFYLTTGVGWHQMPMGYIKGPQDDRDVGVLYVNLNYDIKGVAGISAGVKEDFINAGGAPQDFAAIASMHVYGEDVTKFVKKGLNFFQK